MDSSHGTQHALCCDDIQGESDSFHHDNDVLLFVPTLITIALCGLATLGILLSIFVNVCWILVVFVTAVVLCYMWYDVFKEKRALTHLRMFMAMQRTCRDEENFHRTVPAPAKQLQAGAPMNISEEGRLLLYAKSKFYNSV